MNGSSRGFVSAVGAAWILAAGGQAQGGNWPQWRGPAATGHTEENGKNLPLTWDGKTGANIAWKALLPAGDDAHSSPVVFGNLLFTTATKGFGHQVLCYSTADGKPLWQTPIEPGPFQKTDYRLGGVAAPTPATDGQRVYVLFGTAVMAALDCRDGKVIWRRPLGKYAFDVAMGASPILHGARIMLLSGLTDKTSNLTAFECETGKAAWETVWPEVGFTHSTPAFATVGGRLQLILSVNDKAGGIRGVDPDTGRQLWSAPGDGETSSPAVGPTAIYCDSGRGGGGHAVDLPAPGAGGKLPAKWQLRQVPHELCSPILVGPHIYRLGAGGRLMCLNLADGSEAWQEPLAGASRWASPVASADGRIYFASAGKSYIIQAGPTYQLLAANDLGDPAHCSPAVADGRIYLKGRKNLYCIAVGAAPAGGKAEAVEAESPAPRPSRP